MNYPTNISTWKGKKIRYTWIKTDDFSQYSPITQAYGIIFDDKENILIGRRPGNAWGLPGGSPEGKESLEQTLIRETEEEVDAEITEIVKLGIQKVDFLEEDRTVYQVRYIAKLKKLLHQTEDPDRNEVWERKVVSRNNVLDYLKWGVTGEAIIADAVELLRNNS